MYYDMLYRRIAFPHLCCSSFLSIFAWCNSAMLWLHWSKPVDWSPKNPQWLATSWTLDSYPPLVRTQARTHGSKQATTQASKRSYDAIVCHVALLHIIVWYDMIKHDLLTIDLIISSNFILSILHLDYRTVSRPEPYLRVYLHRTYNVRVQGS